MVRDRARPIGGPGARHCLKHRAAPSVVPESGRADGHRCRQL